MSDVEREAAEIERIARSRATPFATSCIVSIATAGERSYQDVTAEIEAATQSRVRERVVEHFRAFDTKSAHLFTSSDKPPIKTTR